MEKWKASFERILRAVCTVRRLMVAVSLVAIIFGVVGILVRKAEFSRRLEFHNRWLQEQRGLLIAKSWSLHQGRIDFRNPSRERFRFHELMSEKYDRAFRFPWLPVETDPAEPE